MRTRLSICRKKARYASEQDALLAASRAPFPLHPYRCDRCHQMHLTSRTKGRRIARPASILAPAVHHVPDNEKADNRAACHNQDGH
jgi:hypothetical protein